MALQNKTDLLALVNANITTNGANGITGAELNAILTNLNESTFNQIDDVHKLFRSYDPTKSYAVGLPCIYAGAIYQCSTATSGAFNALHWTAISGGGGGATDLSVTGNTTTQLVVASSTGTDATLSSSTGSLAGLHSAADKTKSDLFTITGAANIDTMQTSLSTVITNAGNLVTLSGVATNETTLGTFTGTTIADSVTNKVALQSLETAVELRHTGSGTTGYLPKFTGALTQTDSAIYDSGVGTIGLFGVTSPTQSIGMEGNADRSIGVETRTTANEVGRAISLYSGTATVGATDKNAGAFNILTGNSRGTGTGTINFYTAPAGSSGTGTNAATLKMTINGRGETGFGVASPTAVIHIKAGTATAGTAPLKLSSGTNLSVVEAGAIEFNGTELYFTPSASRLTLLSNRGDALNVFTGKDVANTTLTGNSNIIFGNTLGQGLTTGADNVLIGRGSGATLTTGAGNVTIGAGIQLSNSTGVVAIGRYAALATGTSSNSIYIGDSVNFAGTASSGTVVMIGANSTISSTGSTASSMCLGTGSNITATKQCVIGSDNSASMFTEMIIFGSEGIRSNRSAQLTMVLRLPSMFSNTESPNLDAHTFDIKGSASSGSGGGGDIRLHTTNSAGSGTAINTYSQRIVIKGVTGYIGLQGITTPTAFLHLAATTTAAATLNIPQGTAPTSPNDGDVWREDNTNTGLKIRVNGVTKTITLS